MILPGPRTNLKTETPHARANNGHNTKGLRAMNVDQVITREKRLIKIEEMFKRAEKLGDFQTMADLAALAEFVQRG